MDFLSGAKIIFFINELLCNFLHIQYPILRPLVTLLSRNCSSSPQLPKYWFVQTVEPWAPNSQEDNSKRQQRHKGVMWPSLLPGTKKWVTHRSQAGPLWSIVSYWNHKRCLPHRSDKGALAPRVHSGPSRGSHSSLTMNDPQPQSTGCTTHRAGES